MPAARCTTHSFAELMLMNAWTKKVCNDLCHKTCKRVMKYYRSNTLHPTRGVHTGHKVDIKTLWAGQAGKTEH